MTMVKSNPNMVIRMSGAAGAAIPSGPRGEAIRKVLGSLALDYEAALQSKDAGGRELEAFECISAAYHRALDLRRDTITDTVTDIVAGPKTAPRCAAAYQLEGGAIARCKAPSTTTINGKPFCDRCAPYVPRQEVPEKLRGVA